MLAGSPGYDDMLTDNSLVSFLTSLIGGNNSYVGDDVTMLALATGSPPRAIIPSCATRLRPNKRAPRLSASPSRHSDARLRSLSRAVVPHLVGRVDRMCLFEATAKSAKDPIQRSHSYCRASYCDTL